MSSTLAMLASTQSSPGGKRGHAKDAPEGDAAAMKCSLTLDDCSILASAAAESADMSFRSARRRQERMNTHGRASIDANIHSSSIPGIWRPRRPSTLHHSLHHTLPIRPTVLPPPPTVHPQSLHFALAQHQHSANMSDSSTNFAGQSDSIMAGEDAVPLSRVSPGPVWPSANQLKVAHTYGIRRDDGTYTRLIRADELDSYDFERVPVTQSPEGMIVLPPPEQPRPERRDGPEVMISNDIIQTLPTLGVSRSQNIDETQIDSIIAQAGASPNALAKPSRREKIYCDKWIHEGVCAFTQLGCKYKHEMPMDKATQLSLGLNHGLPLWYKRAQAVQIKPDHQLVETPPSTTRTTGPWRRMNASVSPPSSQPGRGGGISIGHSPYGGVPLFGPIGPPTAQPSPQSSSNPFSVLSADTKSDDDDEDANFVWAGRGRKGY